MIANVFNFGLQNGDLHLTNFDNRQLRLTQATQTKILMCMIDCLIARNSLKSLLNIDNKTNMIIDDYKPKTEPNMTIKV